VVSVGFDRQPRWVDGFAERHDGVSATATDASVALTGGDGAAAEIEVPFPPMSGTDLAALYAHLARQRVVGVLLVRRAGYAIGVFEDTRLVRSKVDSTYVQGTTKAGGWSQQRYARRRGNQAAAAFAQAADVAVRLLVAPERPLDAVMCGGDRAAVRAVLADPRLVPLESLVTGPWLQVKDPKLAALQATSEQFRAVRITLRD
jgi:hypothetical protein